MENLTIKKPPYSQPTKPIFELSKRLGETLYNRTENSSLYLEPKSSHKDSNEKRYLRPTRDSIELPEATHLVHYEVRVG